MSIKRDNLAQCNETSSAELGEVRVGAMVQLGSNMRRREQPPPQPSPNLGEGVSSVGEVEREVF